MTSRPKPRPTTNFPTDSLYRSNKKGCHWAPLFVCHVRFTAKTQRTQRSQRKPELTWRPLRSLRLCGEKDLARALTQIDAPRLDPQLPIASRRNAAVMRHQHERRAGFAV